MKLLLFLFLIQSTWAAEPVISADVWSSGSLYYSFVKDKETGALVSENCLAIRAKCEAIKAVLNKDKVKLSEAERSGGKNPGAVVCKKDYQGEILILKNNAGAESAFCKFKDNTQASASDLY